jgi:hypothetical protein
MCFDEIFTSVVSDQPLEKNWDITLINLNNNPMDQKLNFWSTPEVSLSLFSNKEKIRILHLVPSRQPSGPEEKNFWYSQSLSFIIFKQRKKLEYYTLCFHASPADRKPSLLCQPFLPCLPLLQGSPWQFCLHVMSFSELANIVLIVSDGDPVLLSQLVSCNTGYTYLLPHSISNNE